MSSISPHPHGSASRAETLTNWLALLTLLALGIVWPGADPQPRASTPAAQSP
jgi:hypothetical protein